MAGMLCLLSFRALPSRQYFRLVMFRKHWKTAASKLAGDYGMNALKPQGTLLKTWWTG